MVAAPAVVAAHAVARKGAAKIAGGEGRDAVLQTELLHRALEDEQRLAQFGEQIRVRADDHIVRAVDAVIGLAAVQIVAADLAEKYLAAHPETIRRIAGSAIARFN